MLDHHTSFCIRNDTLLLDQTEQCPSFQVLSGDGHVLILLVKEDTVQLQNVRMVKPSKDLILVYGHGVYLVELCHLLLILLFRLCDEGALLMFEGHHHSSLDV